MKQSKLLALLLSSSILLSLSFSAYAERLQPFKAKFDVDVLGMTIGTLKQSLTCQPFTQTDKKLEPSQKCTLKSIANPPKWAQRFINESSSEIIQLEQTKDSLTWQQYKKHLTRRYDDRVEKKIITLTRRDELQKIEFVEGQRIWPLQDNVFDEISIIYAIQHALNNKTDLHNFYLQGDKDQRKIKVEVKNRSASIDLPFADYVTTTLVYFNNSKMDAKVWFINNQNYFPGRIEINNKTEKRNIVLELKEKPKK